MIGDILDKVPDWIMMIIMGLIVLHWLQIVVGLFIMSEAQHFPKVKINKEVDEWTPIVWLPLKLYYVWIFTDKLTYVE